MNKDLIEIVTMVSTPHCPRCKAASGKFFELCEENEVAFEYLNLQDLDETRVKAIRKSKIMQAPLYLVKLTNGEIEVHKNVEEIFQ